MGSNVSGEQNTGSDTGRGLQVVPPVGKWVDDHYDRLVEFLRQERERTDLRIRRVIAATVDKHEEAWYDLLINGTNGCSVETLKTLGYKRTYPD